MSRILRALDLFCGDGGAAREAMGIDWMTMTGLSQAIPSVPRSSTLRL